MRRKFIACLLGICFIAAVAVPTYAAVRMNRADSGIGATRSMNADNDYDEVCPNKCGGSVAGDYCDNPNAKRCRNNAGECLSCRRGIWVKIRG